MRRFQKRIYVSLPTHEARERLFEQYTAPLKKNIDVRPGDLSKLFDGYSASDIKRPDPLLFFKPAHPAFQASFRQAACSANHNSLWFTSPQMTSLIRSYFFSGFRYLSPIIRHVLTLRMACST